MLRFVRTLDLCFGYVAVVCGITWFFIAVLAAGSVASGVGLIVRFDSWRRRRKRAS